MRIEGGSEGTDLRGIDGRKERERNFVLELLYKYKILASASA